MADQAAKARILIIDDDELMRDTVRDMLEEAGYKVVEATDGDQGIILFEADAADLVITDILMPQKDGVETIIELRRKFLSVKIIAMSGGGSAKNLDFLEFAEKLGAGQLLAKPFTRDELLAAVNEALEAAP